MKPIILLLSILLIAGCHKDAPTPQENIQPNPIHTPQSLDTSSIYLSVIQWQSDTQYNGQNGGYGMVDEQYFVHIDSLPTSVLWSDIDGGDSAISYVLYGHNWIKIPPNPSSTVPMTDTVYQDFSEWYKDGRTFVILYYHSQYYNSNHFPKDTLKFKIFLKPNTSNINP